VKEIGRFQVSDMKIVNLFIFKEQQTSPSSFRFDILAANVRAEIVKNTIAVTQNGDSFSAEVTEGTTKVYKVSMKT
jgi:hypothetical protein